MKAALVACSLCALFIVSLVTVRLKAREAMLCYEIAELETYEELLLDRLMYTKSEMEERTGAVFLLGRAQKLGIRLYMRDSEGNIFPLLLPLDGEADLE